MFKSATIALAAILMSSSVTLATPRGNDSSPNQSQGQGQAQVQGQGQGQSVRNSNTNLSGSESNAVSGSQSSGAGVGVAGSSSTSHSGSSVSSSDSGSNSSVGDTSSVGLGGGVSGISSNLSTTQEGDLLLYLPDPVPINLPAITDTGMSYQCGNSAVSISYIGGASTGVTLWVFGFQHQELGSEIPVAAQNAVKLLDMCQMGTLIQVSNLPDSRKEAMWDILTVKMFELLGVKPSEITLTDLTN